MYLVIFDMAVWYFGNDAIVHLMWLLSGAVKYTSLVHITFVSWCLLLCSDVQSAVRRGARDAFFKADATGAVPAKTETNLRERDVDKESEKTVLSSGLMSRPTPRDVENYIGFASLPNQVYRKSVKRGFEFTLMVVGELLLLTHLTCIHLIYSVTVISVNCIASLYHRQAFDCTS